MAEYSRSWCPECKCWVPTDKMHYFDGLRVCDWCVNGEDTPRIYVRDPYREQVQCIYCDSYDTEEVQDSSGCFRCRECGEIFYI